MSGIQQVLLSTGRVKTITYVGNTSDTSNTDIYTFSGASIGSPRGDRRVHVLVAVDGNAGVDLSSVTVGGVTATLNRNATNSSIIGAIATAKLATGTTADIVVTLTGAKLRCNIGVYASTGLTSETAVDSAQSGVDPGDMTITTVESGFAIALCLTNSGTATVAWTGVTENYDTQVESAMAASGASVATTTTSLNIISTQTNSGALDRSVCASF